MSPTPLSVRRAAPPLLVASALALALLPAHARAGTYAVHGCQGPLGGPATTGGWYPSLSGDTSVEANYCGQGASWLFFVRAPGAVPPGAQSEAAFSAPEDTSIAGYTVARSVRLARIGGSDYAYDLMEGQRPVVVERCHAAEGCTGVGDPESPGSGANVVTRAGLRGVRQLWLGVGCRSAFPCAAQPADAPAKLWLHRTEVTLEDTTAPQLTGPPSGPLAQSATPVSGPASMTFSATDRGGGLRAAVLEVDGREVARTALDPIGCAEPFTAPVPCPLAASATLAFDTRQVPDGAHQVHLRVTDATGQNSAVWGPATIQVLNGCTRDPASASGRISARMTTRRGRRTVSGTTLDTRYGRPVTFGGQLVTAGGAPVPDAPICVATEAELPGAPVVPLASVRTGPDGGFAIRLPTGPSRRVHAIHQTGSGAIVGSAWLRVRTAVRLARPKRALRNGQRLALAGRVLGRPTPARGVLVELQARRGKRWQAFGTTRAKGAGTFTLRYRFTRTRGVQRYRLRARVPDQDGYPYRSSSSRAVTVRVRG